MELNVKYIARSSVAALALMCCLSGCQNGLAEGLPILSESRIKEEKTYSLPEMMLLVATERNRYEEVYTNDIWKVTIDEEGTSFQTHLLAEINGFLEELCALTMLAEERGIVLTEQEKDNLRQLSKVYYEGLTDEDKAYTQATQEDVYRLYQDYHLANKTVEVLTQGIDLEVSDSDAKVISIVEMVMDSQAAAAEAYGKLQEENADFAAIARSYSAAGQISTKLARGEREAAFEEVAFALEEGQVSEIIQSEDSYYIVKCVSAYDEKATAERKETLSQQRKSQAFSQIYQRYTAEHQVELDDTELKTLVFSPEDRTTTTDFFARYQEYMNQ